MFSDEIEAGRELASPADTPRVPRPRQRWAVVLAGGDGTRLQSLTVRIAGDARPKQFCSIFEEGSLLTQTRRRLESLFPLDRQVFVVTRAHETYYREELWNVDDSCIIPQPMNRGTGAAVALALIQILQSDPGAIVAFFPCDHYYRDQEAFGRVIRSATSGAEQYPNSIVLVGATAQYAEVECGWIEPGLPISEASVPLMRVSRFWEKPSLPHARALWNRGCLWNTFVTIGRASTFLDLIRSQVPSLVLSINEALAENELERAYQAMPAINLSRHVLAPQPRRLLAVRDSGSGWADLGNPTRVIDTLVRNNIQPPWWGEVLGSSLPSAKLLRCCRSPEDAATGQASPSIL